MAQAQVQAQPQALAQVQAQPQPQARPQAQPQAQALAAPNGAADVPIAPPGGYPDVPDTFATLLQRCRKTTEEQQRFMELTEQKKEGVMTLVRENQKLFRSWLNTGGTIDAVDDANTLFRIRNAGHLYELNRSVEAGLQANDMLVHAYLPHVRASERIRTTMQENVKLPRQLEQVQPAAKMLASLITAFRRTRKYATHPRAQILAALNTFSTISTVMSGFLEGLMVSENWQTATSIEFRNALGERFALVQHVLEHVMSWQQLLKQRQINDSVNAMHALQFDMRQQATCSAVNVPGDVKDGEKQSMTSSSQMLLSNHELKQLMFAAQKALSDTRQKIEQERSELASSVAVLDQQYDFWQRLKRPEDDDHEAQPQHTLRWVLLMQDMLAQCVDTNNLVHTIRNEQQASRKRVQVFMRDVNKYAVPDADDVAKGQEQKETNAGGAAAQDFIEAQAARTYSIAWIAQRASTCKAVLAQHLAQLEAQKQRYQQRIEQLNRQDASIITTVGEVTTLSILALFIGELFPNAVTHSFEQFWTCKESSMNLLSLISTWYLSLRSVDSSTFAMLSAYLPTAITISDLKLDDITLFANELATPFKQLVQDLTLWVAAFSSK